MFETRADRTYASDEYMPAESWRCTSFVERKAYDEEGASFPSVLHSLRLATHDRHLGEGRVRDERGREEGDADA